MNASKRRSYKASKKHFGDPDGSPYENMANAIILQAVHDYRIAVFALQRAPDCRTAFRVKSDTERFFLSPWFATLTALDGGVLLTRLRRELLRSA